MYLTGFVVFEFLVIASVLGEEYPCYHLRGELAYQHVDDQYRILHGCSSGTGNMNHHHHELQNLLNRAILDSLEYLEMSAQFGRDGVSWEGFKKYFEYLSDRSWKMALKLAEYGNRRGRALSAIEFKSPAIEIAEFGELEALTFAVDKEKELMNGLMDLHKGASAEATYDPDLSGFLESAFMKEQRKLVRNVSGNVATFSQLLTSDPNLATFEFDRFLQNFPDGSTCDDSMHTC